MDWTISLTFTLITMIVSVGSTVFTVGLYFGYLKGKVAELEELKKVVKEYELDFYKHANDEQKHFSLRDWKHLDERLNKIENLIEQLLKR